MEHHVLQTPGPPLESVRGLTPALAKGVPALTGCQLDWAFKEIEEIKRTLNRSINLGGLRALFLKIATALPCAFGRENIFMCFF